jgi:hypothetical protein
MNNGGGGGGGGGEVVVPGYMMSGCQLILLFGSRYG